MTQALGKQSLIEFYDCDEKKLNDPDFLKDMLSKAAIEAGAEIVETVFHTFSPHGVTGVIIIAESHLSIHTWPEHGYAAVDIFTCGDLIDNMKGLDVIKDALKCGYFSIVEMRRGIINKENLKHKVEA
jgi:S-adenosylmethionine decarboxylase